MKKLDHPNVVKLYEVLDVEQDDSLFMGMRPLSFGQWSFCNAATVDFTERLLCSRRTLQKRSHPKYRHGPKYRANERRHSSQFLPTDDPCYRIFT